MNKEFKVGDKVTSRYQGRGYVVGINMRIHDSIEVCFISDGDDSYGIHIFTKYGFRNSGLIAKDINQQELFHGHGTFEFVVDKEPEYEYKILYQSELSDEYHLSTGYYKSTQDFMDAFAEYPFKNAKLLQETKREVK